MDVTKIAAEGMQQDLLRMQSISQNIANVLTPGYKRQIAAQQGFSVQVEKGLAVQPGSTIDARAGTMRFTGLQTDVAVEGEAFFEVATPDGPRYTRQGALRVDAGGRLVGANNFPIMGSSGDIVLAGGPFTVDSSGQVFQDGRVAGQLKLVYFREAQRLEPVGSGMYAQGGASLETAAATVAARVRSGYLENSNVDNAREMVSLTETVRHFEALHRISQGYDEVLGSAIRKLGEF
ncbi:MULTISPECIES: flagellar hook-basal body protein [unclassified Duganella]|uniref:flagellar hook-basal body protein n=1 Tax=unclassified Duganella TaxID=2636909 RepID=UPI00070ED46B|nr:MULTISPECIES: flagellar hook basal-body protein [unclassified Duganella]KRB99166.1 hypothetical protein ASE26_24735 [Duganella sp. Root198D2]